MHRSGPVLGVCRDRCVEITRKEGTTGFEVVLLTTVQKCSILAMLVGCLRPGFGAACDLCLCALSRRNDVCTIWIDIKMEM